MHAILILLAGLMTPADHGPWQQSPAGGSMLWVGAGALCTHSSIQAAIDDAGQGTLIRIANDQAYNFTNLTIADKSLILEGGWAQCGGFPSFFWTELNGAAGNNNPVIRVSSPDNNRTVVLRGLVVQGGQDGGVHVTGRVDLTLEYATLRGNQATIGGGLRITGVDSTQSIVRLGPVIIGADHWTEPNSNTSDSNGGGVHCQNARIVIQDPTTIGGNESTGGSGGGLHLNGCVVETQAPLIVSNNRASGMAGGISASNGSYVDLTGGELFVPHRISGNQAGVNGGGLWLSGTGTTLLGWGLELLDNQATNGGGAYLANSAQMSLSRVLASPNLCPLMSTCTFVAGNEASSQGAAFYVNSSAILSFDHGVIRDNLSPNGSILNITNESMVLLRNSLVADNSPWSGSHVFRIAYDASLMLNSTTVAGNSTGSATISSMALGDFGNSINLVNSIIWQPGQDVALVQPDDNVFADCLNVNEDQSVPGATHDPEFIDPDSGDYRLRLVSPNIDACPDPFGGSTTLDLLGMERPFIAHPDQAPNHFDRGAYERFVDTLFRDRFEED